MDFAYSTFSVVHVLTIEDLCEDYVFFCRITDEVVVACKLLNGHLYKGKEIGREQMVMYCPLNRL